MVSVFVVEDDPGIRDSIVRAFSARGHVVRAAASAMESLAMIVDSPPDIVILDLGLPDVDGSDLLRMLRGVSEVPVVVATARDDEREIVKLLDAGADDYLVKPYSADQLEARMRAVLRRSGAANPSRRIEVGDLVIDLAGRDASLDGRPLTLTRMEFELLAFLAARSGEVVSKRELLAEVWRQPYGGPEKTVDVHLSWLRRKLGESAEEPRYLHTVRGVGVKLSEPQ